MKYGVGLITYRLMMAVQTIGGITMKNGWVGRFLYHKGQTWQHVCGR